MRKIKFIFALTVALLLFSVFNYSQAAMSQTQEESKESACGPMNPTACDTFVRVNYERVRYGLYPLVISKTCTLMAQEQSLDMMTRHYFDHIRPYIHGKGGETFSHRAARFGFVYGIVGENIAINNSPQGATTAWMNSPGHRHNILNSQYKASGMGFIAGYYTQCFTGEVE